MEVEVQMRSYRDCTYTSYILQVSSAGTVLRERPRREPRVPPPLIRDMGAGSSEAKRRKTCCPGCRHPGQSSSPDRTFSFPRPTSHKEAGNQNSIPVMPQESHPKETRISAAKISHSYSWSSSRADITMNDTATAPTRGCKKSLMPDPIPMRFESEIEPVADTQHRALRDEKQRN